MKPVLNVEEVLRLEDLIEKEGTSKAALMEHAGEFAADRVYEFAPKHVVVLCGFGNNGGDGWVAADILSHKGVTVDVVTPIEPNEIKSPIGSPCGSKDGGAGCSRRCGPFS